MYISELINLSIGVSVTPASQASFNIPLLLVDHADIPVDRRYRSVNRSSHAAALTASTEHANWCSALWGQTYNPAIAYIGRWVSAAIAPYNTFPNALGVAATWAALTTTGKFELDDGVNQEDIDTDFTGDTTMALVCASINTGLAASTNFSGYTCALDALNRITITGDTPGAAGLTFATGTPGSGTDLSGSAYLGAEVAQAGLDAETLGAAMTAIIELTNAPFIMCQRGETTAADVAAFSTAVNALDKVLLLVCDDTTAKNTASTSDFPYLINALTHNKVHMCYTEHTTTNGAAANQYPDAAVIGEICARANKEGAISFALNPLTGLSESGLDSDGTTVRALTSDERTALENKGCDYLITPSTQTHLRNGLAAGGNEMRVMIGKSFMAAKCAEGIYGYLVANEVVTYSDPDIQAMKSINSYWAEEMVTRGLFNPATIVWNYPAASSFTAADKDTHTITLSVVFSCEVFSAVNDVVMTMSLSI